MYSNDAFPLLAEYRDKFLTYNDDIQGTAAVTVAGILGALKLKNPGETDLVGALKREYYLFHGAGSANLGALKLLHSEGGVAKSRLSVTNSRGKRGKKKRDEKRESERERERERESQRDSQRESQRESRDPETPSLSAQLPAVRVFIHKGHTPLNSQHSLDRAGLIWKSEDGSDGSFRNGEQAEFARVGEIQGFNPRDLVAVVEHVHPSCVVGAVGVAPGCFTKEVVDAVMKVNGVQTAVNGVHAKHGTHSTERPIIFALSNPKTQAEITAHDAYTWSDGQVIYGSGTQFDPVTVGARKHEPGQVNNVYIFPGLSFGAVCCQAQTIPERMFMVAAEAVANSLSQEDLEADRVMPARSRLREVALNVATSVVLESQKLGLAGRVLGEGWDEVQEVLRGMMWLPNPDNISASP